MRYLFFILAVVLATTFLCFQADAVVFISGGGCVSTISDDFSGDLSKWTEYGSTGAWTIGGGDVDVAAASALIYTDDETCTITQWAMVQFNVTSGAAPSILLRSQNDESTETYAILYDDLGPGFAMYYCGGSTNSNNYEACTAYGWTDHSRGLNAGDYVGVDITGTGTDTVIRVFDLGTTAKNHSNWATSSDWDESWTDDPSPACDTGTYIGLHDFDATAVSFDNVTAGEW